MKWTNVNCPSTDFVELNCKENDGFKLYFETEIFVFKALYFDPL